MKKFYFFLSVMFSLCSCFVEAKEEIEQDFLFLLEEAYTQEPGEWQFSFGLEKYSYHQEIKANSNHHSVKKLSKQYTSLVTFNTEYGISDRLQVELLIPYQKTHYISHSLLDTQSSTHSGVGNTEIRMGYQIFPENSTSPAVTLEFGMIIPATNEKESIRSDAWAYEIAINMSKYLESLGFIHASFDYEVGEHGDQKEWTYGVALVRPLTDNWSGHIEYLYEKEKDRELTDSDQFSSHETETLNTLSVGASYQSEQGFITGIAYEKGNNKEIKDNALNLKVQYEF